MKLRLLLALVVLVLLVVPATLFASVAGSYHGHIYNKDGSAQNLKLSFKVAKGGRSLVRFTAYPGEFCSYSAVGYQVKTFYVPSARIGHGGHFKTTYRLRDHNGNALETNVLEGSLSGRSATGTLKQSGDYCDSGTQSWKARH